MKRASPPTTPSAIDEPRSGTPGARGRSALATLRHAGRRWRHRRGDRFTLAYAHGLSHRLPLLYLIVVFDTLVMGFAFRHAASLLQWAIGIAVVLFGSWRAVHWLPGAVGRRSLASLRKDIDRLSLLGGTSGLVFVGWTLSLYVAGSADQRALIHFVLAVTMFSGILGMSQSPATAFALSASFTVPASICFLLTGHPNAGYVAMVLIVVGAILLFVAQAHHRDFVLLELSRQRLVRRERLAAQQASAHYRQATVDHLTGGLNRRAILARLESELGRAGRAMPWLALVDLDGFKHINDTYGHAAGDVVLRTVSARLGDMADVLAHGRLGGDEFAVLLDGTVDADAALATARRLSAAIREPIAFNGAVLRLCGSIGLHRPLDGSVSACLERADAALYAAKEHGDGTVVLFGAGDEEALQERVTLTRRFNDCTLGDRLRLLYQPVWDVRASRVTGLEALARWSPDGIEWQSPASFLAIAEATGRTGELTRLVMARALEECPPSASGLDISVNLAPRDVIREGFAETLAGIVRDAGEDPKTVVLEVTERALLADPRRTAAQLAAFRAAGFRIALDDFGAGWSSLSQLRHLPLDLIKLDRELAEALPTDPGARAMTGMIVALSWQLGIACSIEGVESEAVASAARSLGVTLMQGYHFGRPEPAELALAGATRAVA